MGVPSEKTCHTRQYCVVNIKKSILTLRGKKMTQEIKGRTLTVKFEHETLAELDRISERLNYKRSETIRRLLELGIETFQSYEKIGLVKIIEIRNRTKKAVKEETQPTLFKV